MKDVMDILMVNYVKVKDKEAILEITPRNPSIAGHTLEGAEAETLYNLLRPKEEIKRPYQSIVTIFIDLFPMYKNSRWIAYGKNAIKLEMYDPIIVDNNQYIFTYNNEKEWSLETLKNYQNKMKEQKE